MFSLFLPTLLTAALTAQACPFCATQGQTLAGELAAADMIVVATVVKSERDANDFTKSWSELKIDKTIKPHPAFEKKDKLVVPRYIPTEKGKTGPQLLLFCYVNSDPTDAALAAVVSTPAVYPKYRNATIDAYRGDEIKANSKLPDYLEKARTMAAADPKKRLAFYFEHLEDNELFISGDAYMEFGNASYADVRPVAATLSADTLLKWLTDPNTAPARHGLYGMLLGHCGKKEHADTLRKLISDPDNAFSLGLDGMLAGLILLDPKGGWEVLSAIAGDRKKEFTTRYAALRTVRFFRDHRPDAVPADQLLSATQTLCEQDDIADIAIDDLRKWHKWDKTEYVLGLAARETHTDPLVRRAILRFALHASRNGSKPAAEYVDGVRKVKPQMVKDAEDLLENELPKPKK